MLTSNLMLTGKVAVVTGASRGIGAAVATSFARAGAEVWLCGRSETSLLATYEACKAENTTVNCVAFDVMHPQEVKAAYLKIRKASGGIDILVNNAGILKDALLGMITTEQLQDVYQTNVFGPIYNSQYAARLMGRKGGGSIINISSIIGVNGNAGQAVYGGSKAAIIGATKSLAKELATQHIRVNAIAPGFIDTDMARQLDDETFKKRLDSIAMDRIGSSQDIANCALFLASDLSTYITGQVIGVDGGMLI